MRGARYDSPAAPATELAWARGGTAYFARKLSELTDEELTEASLLPGWTRAALVAHVGYNARALTRLCEWARTGVETPMYASTAQRNAEIERGATLPARALRHLFAHSEVHLNVEWRDLTDEQWDAEVRTAQGRTVPARETAWMRAREVWIHAVDLDNGASFLDFPPALVDRLIADVTGMWERRGERLGLVLEPTDREGRTVLGAGGPTVRGAAADLAPGSPAAAPAAWSAPRAGSRNSRAGSERDTVGPPHRRPPVGATVRRPLCHFRVLSGPRTDT